MKPRVLTRCVANAYTAKNERIIEFSFPGTEDGKGDGPKGGLIQFRLNDNQPVVHLYRIDRGVKVYITKEPK